MQSKIIQQGAEAIIYRINNKIVKNRIPKLYRLKELDNRLRKRRTKSEAKIINKLQDIIPVPRLLADPGQGRMIHMQYLEGKKLSEHLENLNWQEICKQIAENISKLHDQDITHGDLTTSNMIYVDNNSNPNKESSTSRSNLSDTKNNVKQSSEADCKAKDKKEEVFFIDFGLAFHSHKIEDKAVDLHLLKQALEAKHFKIADQAIKIILNNYKANQHKEIIEKIQIIEKRGRYKH